MVFNEKTFRDSCRTFNLLFRYNYFTFMQCQTRLSQLLTNFNFPHQPLNTSYPTVAPASTFTPNRASFLTSRSLPYKNHFKPLIPSDYHSSFPQRRSAPYYPFCCTTKRKIILQHFVAFLFHLPFFE